MKDMDSVNLYPRNQYDFKSKYKELSVAKYIENVLWKTFGRFGKDPSC